MVDIEGVAGVGVATEVDEDKGAERVVVVTDSNSLGVAECHQINVRARVG